MSRMLARLLFAAAFLAAAPLCARLVAATPRADHHQHLFSPAFAALLTSEGKPFQPLTARDLVAMLDAAGIRQAVVLSAAYAWGSPARSIGGEYAKVRAENDWNAAQAARYPGRLRAFCSFNPLQEYALDELARCAASPGLERGIKLHFGNSDVQLDNPAHLERLREVFRAANAHRMAIVLHMRASVSNQRPYGAAQARIFVEQLLPMAPDVPVQVAHLAGAGPGYDDPAADSVMAVLAEAVERHDARTRNLWFDVASLADDGISPQDAARLVRRIRQVGAGRILYGSDAAAGANLHPREGWAAFRRLPLTDAEFARIADNVAPYLQ